MRYLKILFNILYIIYRFLGEKQHIDKYINEKKDTVLLELCPDIILQFTFHNILANILNKKYKVIFFYNGSLKLNFMLFFFKLFYKRIGINFLDVNNVKKRKKIIFESKTKLLNFKYKKYFIGKYIYQSYCRTKYEATPILNDPYLHIITSEAISKIINLEDLFSKNKIKYILTTHTVFINYGLIALVGRKFNSKIKIIYPENNYNNIRVLDVDKKTLIQIDKYYEYKKEFKKIENKQNCYKASEDELKKRIYKNISNAKVSNVRAYDKSHIPIFNSQKPKIIILPSCFYDAHHFFRYSLFKDVAEWLEFTLHHASKTNFEWYVKPHPASHKMNFKIYEKLKLKYKKINFLNPNVSNLAFLKNNFCSMFTFQSSAVHEFAFMNIPSVIVTDNVSVNYSFGKPVMNKSKYKFMIYNADKIKKKINYKDILEFNYMWRFDKSSSFKNYILSKKRKKNMKNNLNSFKDSFDLINNFLKNKSYQYKLSKISLDIFK